MRTIAVLAVAATLVLAGCAAPSGPGTTDAEPSASAPAADSESVTEPSTASTDATTATATTTAAPTTSGNDSSWDTDDAPTGDGLPANDTATFRNLTALVGVDAERPALTVLDASQDYGTPLTRYVLLGLDDVDPLGLNETYGYATPGEIYVAPKAASERAVERVLVHEQFHVVQFQQGWVDPYGDPPTTDGRVAWRGVVEGTAVWVTDRYVDRHHAPGATAGRERHAAVVEDGPSYNRLFSAPYLFGARWTDHHVDDPANVSWAYENVPTTSEQLMHNRTPAEEPIDGVDLAIRSEDWFDRDADRLGELYVWATLRGELSANRSRTAAAGWGGDAFTMVADTSGRTETLAWALRWDGERDADEFTAAARDWAAARDDDVAIRVLRVNATTSVVLAGQDAFVGNATADVEGGTVVVAHGNATAATDARGVA
ncbi:hypothetical protein [Halorubellus salinus]|uniref:hypothetical protein n=1 Tax=Halorubellus salinus TaxID=755309 RepID=UPI001D088E36|nr:hypothetical protein [Halorubellus salinus]